MRRLVLAGASLLLLLLAACGAPAASSPADVPASTTGPRSASAAAGCAPAVVGHRGEPAVAPEETLPSFEAAIRDGARTIEMDVRFTRDLVPVLLHDDTLDRTTDGTGAPERLTAAQVARLDAGSWRGRQWRGTRVPTLREVLVLAHHEGVHAIVELKLPGVTAGQLSAFRGVIRVTGMVGETTVESSHPANLQALHAVAPSMPTALVAVRALDPSVARRSGQTLIESVGQVTPARVVAWHSAGLKVIAWTPNTPAEWEAMRAAGVDAVLTDEASAYARWAAAGCRPR